jgi:hypothetical protein
LHGDRRPCVRDADGIRGSEDGVPKTKKRTTKKATRRTQATKVDGRAIAKALRNATVERGRGWTGIRFF